MEGDETKEGKADTPGAPPQGLGSRADLSSRELLYDYLVHITLNELIPVDAEMFRNSKKYSRTMKKMSNANYAIKHTVNVLYTNVNHARK